MNMQAITKKTLVPVSLIIALFPIVSYIFSLESKYELLAAQVNDISDDKRYLVQKLEAICQNIEKIQLSIGIIEHEIRESRKDKIDK